MWVVWFILHHPAVGLAPALSGPILIAIQGLALITSTARWLAAPGRPAPTIILTAALAGLATGLVNLIAMGSMLVPQADPAHGLAAQDGPTLTGGDRPSLALMVAGYLAVSAGIGIVAGASSAFGLRPRTASPSARDPIAPLRRLAFIALAATLPLLLLGGLVTTTRSGLAVPDWPGTYQGNMFLYPISLMASSQPVYLEHSHRLFGALVGLTSIALLATALRVDRRIMIRGLAGAIFALVCLQGLLGGYRVTEKSQFLAASHGVLGQVIFLLMGVFAGTVTLAYRQGPTAVDPTDRRRRALGTALVHTLTLQLIFGAMYRHTGSPHALYTHIGFAFLVATLGLVAGMVAASRKPDGSAYTPAVRTAGTTVVALVALQFILGWGAWAANPPSDFQKVPTSAELHTLTPQPAWKVAIRTAHQGNGALLIGAAGVLFALVRRRPTTSATLAHQPDGTPDPTLSATAKT
jgi:cytochrome c oxidase assembly protein subunit 15